MKQLSIVSGKGGTGKTSLAACFASLAAREGGIQAVSVDCDVDASNLHLLLGGKTVLEEPFSGPKVAVAPDKSLPLSDECRDSCVFGAISELEIDPLLCVGCGACLLSRPDAGITMEERQTGILYRNETEYGDLFHARLFPGNPGFGGMITRLRKRAEEIAMKKEGGWILIDGSPGIGCQVIASLAGADLAIVVTEPSRSGLHDAERILSLLQHFGIKALACINKYDLNPHHCRDMERELAERGIPVAGKIPYDPAVTEAVTRGVPLVDCGKGDAADAIERTYNDVMEELRD